ncbi:MAG TPA: endonuclease domain-containing protein [Burkholderiales bacterium]|nr:endonuclease domain-containing protein [Burkholderiales bacterium]
MAGARWIPYRTKLTPRAQALRRDPTPAEKKLWYEFLRDLPHKFTRQKPLGQYVADFYCSRQRLVIELDGDSHYTDRAQHYDQVRTAALEMRGLRVMRFTNTDVLESFEAVCAAICVALGETPQT